MMTIKKLQERMKDPIVRDHALIRKATEEMVQLPVTSWCKSSIILTKTKEPLRKYVLRDICQRLSIPQDDARIETLGKLMMQMNPSDMDVDDYQRALVDLSCIGDFFGLPKKEEKT